MTTTGLKLYERTAEVEAARVLSAYSSSFGLASRLFSRTVRRRVATLYALVRIADEIVDGPARAAGLDADGCRETLDRLEDETSRALVTGYSANLIVHAFAATARTVGITTALTEPFFASMRRDLHPVEFAQESELDAYVYGSAEVVGLMCLAVFTSGLDPDPGRDARWQRGARALGSAFQRVNFLRDLGEDLDELGRRYFPGVSATRFDDAARDRLLDRIDLELRTAAEIIPELPASSRRAVAAAHAIYAELAGRLRRTPARDILRRRVRVRGARKGWVVARALVTRAPASTDGVSTDRSVGSAPPSTPDSPLSAGGPR